MTAADTEPQAPQKSGISVGMVILISLATSVLAVWLAFAWLFPKSFTPVSLNPTEQTALEQKVKTLHIDLSAVPDKGGAEDRTLDTGVYTESDAARQIVFSQREINALLASNTDLGSRVAINLSPGLISLNALIPLDPDVPVMGGKTLRISAGVALGTRDGRPMVVLRGVSLWGVPLPNSWLGDLKNVDLVHEYGNEGFWKSFAEGVDNISVGDGVLSVKLKE